MTIATLPSITLDTVAQTFTKIVAGPTNSLFQTEDGKYIIKINQSATPTQIKSEITLQCKKVAADPLSTLNKEIAETWVIRRVSPVWGFTTTDALGHLNALIGALQASTNTLSKQVIARES